MCLETNNPVRKIAGLSETPFRKGHSKTRQRRRGTRILGAAAIQTRANRSKTDVLREIPLAPERAYNIGMKTIHAVAWVICICSTALLFGDSAPLTTNATVPTPDAQAKTVVIPLNGEVNDYTRDDLLRRFQQARDMGAKTIIFRINTYGGLVTAGLDISRFLRDQTDVHTIAFVKTKAISAGAMIAIACDEIVMSPGSQIGNCAPIIFSTDGQIEPLPAAERAKEESPVLSDF